MTYLEMELRERLRDIGIPYQIGAPLFNPSAYPTGFNEGMNRFWQGTAILLVLTGKEKLDTQISITLTAADPDILPAIEQMIIDSRKAKTGLNPPPPNE